MRKITHLICLFGILVLFSACPYQSSVPLQTAEKSEDELHYLTTGKWKCLTEDYDIHYVEMPSIGFDSEHYEIKVTDAMSTSTYKAWQTHIGSSDFFYVEIDHDGKITYAIYKMKVEFPYATSWELKPEAMEGKTYKTTNELREIISKLEGDDNNFTSAVKWALI